MMRSNVLKKMLVLLSVPVAVGVIHVINAFSQTEVSTQVVGFVREVDNDAGVYRFATIPFSKLNETTGVRRHYVNKMDTSGNAVGIHDPGTDGIFDLTNFSDGDIVKKYDTTLQKFTTQLTVSLFTNGTGRLGYTVPGWYEPKPPNRWALTKLYFDDGESFLIQYKIAPASKTTHGTTLTMIGEFDNSDIVTTIMPAGYKFMGNPFPVDLHLTQAFTQYSDNDSTKPYAGTGTNPSREPLGDLIRIGYNPTTGAWQYVARYWRNPADGVSGWYYSQGPTWKKVPATSTETGYSNWFIKPGKGCLYYAKVPFFWKVKAPQM